MARKGNEKVSEAERRYKDGEKLVDIARDLGLPPGTVRRWKSTYNWDGEEGERIASVRKEKANARKKERTVEKKILASVEANDELTEKQKLFCVYYIHSFNATQSYLKAYGCEYNTANVNGPELLVNPRIQQELQRLKEIKKASLLVGVEDLVEKQMRIAFADLSDYVEWGREEVPVMAMYGPVQVTDPETGEKKTMTKEVNVVRFKDSGAVDGSILSEVKMGRDGASIKLADRQKALQWLSDYFMANPMDRHKVEYELKRLELEIKAQQRDDPLDVEDDPLTKSIEEALANGLIDEAAEDTGVSENEVSDADL